MTTRTGSRYGAEAPQGSFGRVAQLVEQWIENPCVVGSIPTPATPFDDPQAPFRRRRVFLLRWGRALARVLVAGGLSGCLADPCNTLCLDVALRLDDCRDAWGLAWEDLGAPSRAGWRTDCQAAWDDTRAGLEARQVPGAEATCEDASATLEDATCDELRALYVEP